jgi:O-succinylbenzoic acid--CoA ligase
MLSSPWIETRARLTPDRVAIECAGESLHYGELAKRARALAVGLVARGIQPGDVVAALLPNGIPFATLLHAIDLVGAIFLPLNARLAPRELTYPLGDSAARLLLHDHDALGEKARLTALSAPGVEALVIDDLMLDASSPIPTPTTDADAPFAILYTSGTTGRPKGACLSRNNFVASALASALHSGVLPGERWLACMPLFHVGGLSILVRSVLYGTTTVLHDRFDAAAVDAALEDESITLLSLTATMLQRLLEVRQSTRPPPFLRCILLGGGPCPASLLERAAKQGLIVSPTYGLTEACSQVATRLPDDVSADALTPLPCVEVRTVGDDGRDTPTTEPGEIWIRGATVIRSYLTPNDANQNPRPDGWLMTGDIGTLDAQGRLRVLDRRSDLIISGGENIYPAEVEAALMEHAGVAEAAVAGIHDGVFGQRPAAWFIPTRGTPTPEDDELATHCRQRLAGYKVPIAFHPVDDLPRTSAGKVLRRQLRATGN